MSLDQINVILQETSHPGNIGSAARAMKTMGLSKLSLVNPNEFPSKHASALACSAADVLDQATVSPHLHDALGDAHLIIGTSARLRNQQTPCLSVQSAAKMIIKTASEGKKVALLFGPERTGLDNQALAVCHYHLYIDANPDYSSLNLAAAVQIVAYEIYQAHLQSIPANNATGSSHQLASFKEMQDFYAHLSVTLKDLDMLNDKNPKGIMKHLSQVFKRAQPYTQELRLLRGFLKQAQLKSTGRIKISDTAE